MKRSAAVARLEGFLSTGADAEAVMDYLEKELRFQPLRYKGTGRLHTMREDSGGDVEFITDWEPE